MRRDEFFKLDWRYRLNTLIDKRFNIKHHNDYTRLCNESDNWFSCACGSLDPRISREEPDGQPKDAKLAHLGVRFCSYIDANCWEVALATLNAIEQREQELLQEIEDEN